MGEVRWGLVTFGEVEKVRWGLVTFGEVGKVRWGLVTFGEVGVRWKLVTFGETTCSLSLARNTLLEALPPVQYTRRSLLRWIPRLSLGTRSYKKIKLSPSTAKLMNVNSSNESSN
ncbi:hypothetical protein BC008_07705 [Mastigocoleus testarum BC008]|uniref:Uncharacterized protein n=1 Tax=Mastigocoleus testarum BC008 TaxID=371196 RepID=A0A0V7ZBN0_9CYAN|nr:hypothetical protein BC008_07705 [Mastigocoleus testarum BC008]